jgi:hypothetical protein
MSHFCIELHKIANSRTRYRFPFNHREIPKNGIYILFEQGERGHEGDRIVRIGTHTGVNQLRSRLKQHFVQENKDRSIFRKNIGRCILNKSNDPYLTLWELDCTTTQAKAKYGPLLDRDYQLRVERLVSRYIQESFSFCVLAVDDKDERLYLESKLISTVSACKLCKPSSEWLGLSSPVKKIQASGLWQVNGLYKEAINSEELQRLVELIT